MNGEAYGFVLVLFVLYFTCCYLKINFAVAWLLKKELVLPKKKHSIIITVQSANALSISQMSYNQFVLLILFCGTVIREKFKAWGLLKQCLK